MTRLFTPLATLLSLLVAGCAATHSSRTSGAPAPYKYNAYDNAALLFGHEASPAEKRPITMLVNAYYAAAAKDEGKRACSMLHSWTVEATVDEYRDNPHLRGDSCAVILSKLFRKEHHRLAIDHATLEITSVRISGRRALVLPRFEKAFLPVQIGVRIEGGRWKIWDLFDTPIP